MAMPSLKYFVTLTEVDSCSASLEFITETLDNDNENHSYAARVSASFFALAAFLSLIDLSTAALRC
jgi:hypothetical protein